jgi:hypothetical protein
MKRRLGMFTPILAEVRRASRAATSWIGKERRRACVLMPAYLTVVGHPTLGLTSLTRHGKAELEGKRIDKGNEWNVGHGRKEIVKGSYYSDGEYKWGMKNRG